MPRAVFTASSCSVPASPYPLSHADKGKTVTRRNSLQSIVPDVGDVDPLQTFIARYKLPTSSLQDGRTGTRHIQTLDVRVDLHGIPLIPGINVSEFQGSCAATALFPYPAGSAGCAVCVQGLCPEAAAPWKLPRQQCGSSRFGNICRRLFSDAAFRAVLFCTCPQPENSRRQRAHSRKQFCRKRTAARKAVLICKCVVL